MFKKIFGGLLGGRSESQAPRSFEQRRKTARRSCTIEVQLGHGRDSQSVQLVNMSVGGLCLQCGARLKVKPKSTLRVTYPESIPKVDSYTTDCVVRWSKLRAADSSQLVGLEFKDQKGMGKSWVKAKMHDLGFQSYNLLDQRVAHRVDCQIPATLDIGGVVGCAIKNIGLGGLLLHLRQPIRAGATITVKVGKCPGLEGTTYTATVRHQQQADPGDPFGYGCVFTSLSDEQKEALQEFMLAQQEINWDKVEHWSDGSYETFGGDNDDVEIPELSSILDESSDGDDETSS